jgi:hypothetical protein
MEECGPCPVFASFTLAFALQLRKKHGDTLVRARKTSVRLKNLSHNTVYILSKTPTHYKTLTNTHITVTHSYTHTRIHASNKMQRYRVYIWKLLYMFRMVLPPIIRSAYNCIYSIWYLSQRYCYLPLSWKSWNRFECCGWRTLLMMGVSTT